MKCFFLDVVFMVGEMHNDTRSERDRRQGINSMLPRNMPAQHIDQHMRMVARLRGERMVVHVTQIWRTRANGRKFTTRVNDPVVVNLMGPFVTPIHKVNVDPRFMMTTLIIRSQSECFPRDGESHVYFPKALRTRRFERSTDVCPVVRNGSGSPQRCGDRWRRQGTV